MASARCVFKTHFTNLNKVADLSDADRSGLSNLQISDEDLQKVNAEVETRFREFFATVDPVIQNKHNRGQIAQKMEGATHHRHCG